MNEQSIWQDIPKPELPSLQGDGMTDVLIIGGGMAGVLCAKKLADAGVDYMLVEGGAIGDGTTGRTTAKITAQHGAIYHKLLSKHGDEIAGAYYQANTKAIDEFRNLAKTIPCDFQEKISYVYTTNNQQAIESEHKAYNLLGIKSHMTRQANIPIKTYAALGMGNQAQFHPLKLLYGVAKDLNIYENTFIQQLDGRCAITERGKIHAKYIVLATHFPMVNIKGGYFVKLHQHRSYLAAVENAMDVDGMYMDEDKQGFSFRNYGDYLLVGGGAHKTGYSGGGYGAIDELVKAKLPSSNIAYRWAAQDCMPLDDLPYIGIHKKSTPHMMVATGFQKWGMTGSMVAAMIISDLILHDKSEYAGLFSPGRSMLHGQLAVNLGSAVMNMVRINRRCTHMGCALKWNKQENTWDCPCHGSRYSQDGNVLENPAKKNKK